MKRFSQEFLLVAACCAWPLSDERLRTIRSLASPTIDWHRLKRIVERHRVYGLAANALAKSEAAVPREFARDLADRAKLEARQSLVLTAEAIRLHALFDATGIPHLFLKGATLAILVYGNLGIRHTKDIDVLVPPDQIDEAIRVLKDAGYSRISPPAQLTESLVASLRKLRKDSAFIHEKFGHEVELHWRLFDNRWMLPKIGMKSAAQWVRVSETESLPTLNREDLFAYLCGHGAYDGWFRMKWLADVAALMSTSSVDQLYRTSILQGAGPAVGQALLLSNRLLGVQVPNNLMRELGSSFRVRVLENLALWAITTGHEETALPDVPFGGTRIMFSHLFLNSTVRYGFEELRVHLTSTRDMLMLPLPRYLHFLYPMLRLPLWIGRRLMGHSH